MQIEFGAYSDTGFWYDITCKTCKHGLFGSKLIEHKLEVSYGVPLGSQILYQQVNDYFQIDIQGDAFLKRHIELIKRHVHNCLDRDVMDITIKLRQIAIGTSDYHDYLNFIKQPIVNCKTGNILLEIRENGYEFIKDSEMNPYVLGECYRKHVELTKKLEEVEKSTTVYNEVRVVLKNTHIEVKDIHGCLKEVI